MKKVIMFIPLTREWRAQTLASQIESLNTTNIDLTVLIYIDNPSIERKSVDQKFKDIKTIIYKTREWHFSEINIGRRRERITKVFEKAKKWITKDYDYVFVLEDDTNLDTEILQELIRGYETNSDVGIMSAVQAGRWADKIVGAWITDNPDRPTTLQTVEYTNELVIEEVDATGFYCFIIKPEDYLSLDFRFNFFGPDVCAGIDLRRQGKKNFIDWRLKVDHVGRNGLVLVDKDCIVNKYRLIGNTWVKQETNT